MHMAACHSGSCKLRVCICCAAWWPLCSHSLACNTWMWQVELVMWHFVCCEPCRCAWQTPPCNVFADYLACARNATASASAACREFGTAACRRTRRGSSKALTPLQQCPWVMSTSVTSIRGCCRRATKKPHRMGWVGSHGNHCMPASSLADHLLNLSLNHLEPSGAGRRPLLEPKHTACGI